MVITPRKARKRPGKRGERSRAGDQRLALCIGRHLRGLREEAGLTQAQLGGDRYSKSLVSKIEAGRALPSLETLLWFAQQLEIGISEAVPADL